MSDRTSESASHFCRICGAWWLCSWDGAWQLKSEQAGEDCCNNQPMHGNTHLVSVRAALEAIGNIAGRGDAGGLRAELDAEKEARSNDQKYYQEAVAAANEGRPLGPVIGAQTIINQQEEIKRLRAENAALRKKSRERDKAIWRAALTFAHNINVQESDRINADDGSLEACHALSECCTRIRGYLEPPDEQLAEMFAEAGVPDNDRLTAELTALRAWKGKVEKLGYLAGIAAATPEQLEELRKLCRPQEGA